MNYDTFIFDLDGTLLNTLDDLASAVNHALCIHGMPVHSTEDVRHFVGNGARVLMERAVPDGARNPLFNEVLAAFRQYYMEHSLDATRPYDGVEDMLEELQRRGCHIAVVSNKFMTATQQLVRHFFPMISIAIGEHEAEGIRRKPAPDTVLEALRMLGASSPAVLHPVYVGDSEVDLSTARNAGLPCISVLWGFRERQFLEAHGATTFISAPQELLRNPHTYES